MPDVEQSPCAWFAEHPIFYDMSDPGFQEPTEEGPPHGPEGPGTKHARWVFTTHGPLFAMHLNFVTHVIQMNHEAAVHHEEWPMGDYQAAIKLPPTEDVMEVDMVPPSQDIPHITQLGLL